MATLSFTATAARVDADEDVLIAAVESENPYQYVVFQRDPEDGEEDWGIHFEVNDQINSGYDCISSCSLWRNRLMVELRKPVDWQQEFTRFEITLDVADADFDAFAEMLRRIFREQETLLAID